MILDWTWWIVWIPERIQTFAQNSNQRKNVTYNWNSSLGHWKILSSRCQQASQNLECRPSIPSTLIWLTLNSSTWPSSLSTSSWRGSKPSSSEDQPLIEPDGRGILSCTFLEWRLRASTECLEPFHRTWILDSRLETKGSLRTKWPSWRPSNSAKREQKWTLRILI